MAYCSILFELILLFDTKRSISININTLNDQFVTFLTVKNITNVYLKII